MENVTVRGLTPETGVLGSLGDKAAAGKEIDEGWKGGFDGSFEQLFGL